LAGTGTSYQTGTTATYTNTALLAAAPTRRLSFGHHAAEFRLHTAGVQAQHLNDDSQAAHFGITTPLPFPEPIADRLVLGLGVSTAGAHIARVQILRESTPQFPLLGPRAESLNFNLGLGARLPSGMYVGVGTLGLASLQGSVALDASGAAAESVTDDELVITHAPTLGVAYQPDQRWAAGVAWRSELRSEFDLQVTIENLGDVVIPPLHVAGLAQVDPAQLSLEGSYSDAGIRVIAGLTRKYWSAIPRLKSPTVQCPADQSDCAAPVAEPLGLEDTLVPRAAAEVQVRLTHTAISKFRAGYFYEPTPFPAQRGARRMFDNTRHVVSVGYGLELDGARQDFELNLGVQLHELVERTHPVAPAALSSDGRIVSFALDAGVSF
jgi:long-chain fatty acid transport protein